MPWVAANNRHTENEQIGLKIISLEAAGAGLGVGSWGRGGEGMGDPGQVGYIHPGSIVERVGDEAAVFVERGYALLYARTHPQFVLKAYFDDKVPDKSLVLNEVQRLNFEVTTGEELIPWSLYDDSQDRDLVSICVEIRPRYKNLTLSVDKGVVAKVVSKQLWGFVLTVHERILVLIDGVEFAIRVTEVEVEQGEEDAEAGAKEDALFMSDEYRGRVATTTRIYVEMDRGYYEGDFTLTGEQVRVSRPAQSNIIDVYCNDEEWFPVKKRLLQPCVALAKHVLDDSDERQSVHVDLDCCTFDKVLLYLEAEARGEKYTCQLLETDQLLDAAKKMRLIGLQRLCEKMLGEYSSSIRHEGIPWDEVVKRNNEGELLLVIDGQVCDVTVWLELHPGGNTIIPAQALNCDATVLFEVYHSSRESFLYLKQLYIGPLKEEDLHRVPPPTHQRGQAEPSDSFLFQFREYMGQVKKFKSW